MNTVAASERDLKKEADQKSFFFVKKNIKLKHFFLKTREKAIKSCKNPNQIIFLKTREKTIKSRKNLNQIKSSQIFHFSCL